MFPVRSVARCIDVGLTADAGVETCIAWEGETPGERHHDNALSETPAGITLMSTPRQSTDAGAAGRALFDATRRLAAGPGVARFDLAVLHPGGWSPLR